MFLPQVIGETDLVRRGRRQGEVRCLVSYLQCHDIGGAEEEDTTEQHCCDTRRPSTRAHSISFQGGRLLGIPHPPHRERKVISCVRHQAYDATSSSMASWKPHHCVSGRCALILGSWTGV